VKELVERFRSLGAAQANMHSFEVRPWGKFEILRASEKFKTKVIVVDPGAQISYQSHRFRSEHWVITEGSGEVVLDDKVMPVKEGQHVFIPVGSKHRIRNPSSSPLQFVEVQVGESFAEEDIIRFQDDYSRT
jgi:mannose-6-phosphate isomerase-like protein (cupin superfamily)